LKATELKLDVGLFRIFEVLKLSTGGFPKRLGVDYKEKSIQEYFQSCRSKQVEERSCHQLRWQRLQKEQSQMRSGRDQDEIRGSDLILDTKHLKDNYMQISSQQWCLTHWNFREGFGREME
jgi:hypothetical protein